MIGCNMRAGTYRRRLDLASSRFAMIDDGLRFSLVPWSPSLEQLLGRHVSGVARIGRIEWSFGWARGPTSWLPTVTAGLEVCGGWPAGSFAGNPRLAGKLANGFAPNALQ
jgi:hypothetical protein